MQKHDGSAVVLDIENLFFKAAGDRLIEGAHWPDLARLFASHLKEIAESYGPIQTLYSVMSLRLEANIGRSLARTIKVLIDAGFEVAFVTYGQNAADFKIAERCQSYAADPKISHIVLATGDGQEPFPSIVENLSAHGKKVHLAVYDQVPSNFSCQDLRITQLASKFRLIQQEKSAAENPHQKVEETAVIVKTADSPRVLYRKAAQAILLGGECSETHRRQLETAAMILKHQLCGRRDSHSLGRLIRILEFHFPNEGFCLSQDEIVQVLHVLTDYTDIFQKKEMYSPNEQSEFLANLKL